MQAKKRRPTFTPPTKMVAADTGLNRNGFTTFETFNQVPRTALEHKPVIYSVSNGKTNGRDTLYIPQYDHVCYKLRLLGKNNKEIADIIGVKEPTFQVWRSKFPSFKAAWEAGGDLADSDVAFGLYKAAIGYEHPETKVFHTDTGFHTHTVLKHYPPNANAAQYWLNNRNAWRWKTTNSTELTGAGGKDLPAPLLNITFIDPATLRKDASSKTIEGEVLPQME
jgi:hypothetical protein